MTSYGTGNPFSSLSRENMGSCLVRGTHDKLDLGAIRITKYVTV